MLKRKPSKIIMGIHRTKYHARMSGEKQRCKPLMDTSLAEHGLRYWKGIVGTGYARVIAENPRTAIAMAATTSITKPERSITMIDLECWYIADTLYCIMAGRHISPEQGWQCKSVPCVVKTTKKPAVA